MSDLTELWNALTGKKDPKALSPQAFLAKEEQNLKNAISSLPAPIQNFVDVGVTSVAALGEAAISVESPVLGAAITAGMGELQKGFQALLAQAFGTTDAKLIAAAAATPAGQSVLQTVGAAAVASVTHLAASAQAGIAIGAANITGAPAPQVPAGGVS